LYPSLPGVEGAQGTPAGGPEARLAAYHKKKQLAQIKICLNNSLDSGN